MDEKLTDWLSVNKWTVVHWTPWFVNGSNSFVKQRFSWLDCCHVLLFTGQLQEFGEGIGQRNFRVPCDGSEYLLHEILLYFWLLKVKDVAVWSTIYSWQASMERNLECTIKKKLGEELVMEVMVSFYWGTPITCSCPLSSVHWGILCVQAAVERRLVHMDSEMEKSTQSLGDVTCTAVFRAIEDMKAFGKVSCLKWDFIGIVCLTQGSNDKLLFSGLRPTLPERNESHWTRDSGANGSKLFTKFWNPFKLSLTQNSRGWKIDCLLTDGGFGEEKAPRRNEEDEGRNIGSSGTANLVHGGHWESEFIFGILAHFLLLTVQKLIVEIWSVHKGLKTSFVHFRTCPVSRSLENPPMFEGAPDVWRTVFGVWISMFLFLLYIDCSFFTRCLDHHLSFVHSVCSFCSLVLIPLNTAHGSLS